MKRKILLSALFFLFSQMLSHAQQSSSSTNGLAALKAFVLELPSLMTNIRTEAQLILLQTKLGDLKDDLDRVSSKKQQIAKKVRNADLQNMYTRQYLINDIRKAGNDVENIVKSLNDIKQIVRTPSTDRALQIIRDSLQVKKEDVLERMVSDLRTSPFKVNKDQIMNDAIHAKTLADDAAIAIDDVIDKISIQLEKL